MTELRIDPRPLAYRPPPQERGKNLLGDLAEGKQPCRWSTPPPSWSKNPKPYCIRAISQIPVPGSSRGILYFDNGPRTGVQRKRGPCCVHRVTVHFLSMPPRASLSGTRLGPQCLVA
jgi:hypothetical protein